MSKTRKSMRAYIVALTKRALDGSGKRKLDAIQTLAVLALLFEEAAVK